MKKVSFLESDIKKIEKLRAVIDQLLFFNSHAETLLMPISLIQEDDPIELHKHLQDYQQLYQKHKTMLSNLQEVYDGIRSDLQTLSLDFCRADTVFDTIALQHDTIEQLLMLTDPLEIMNKSKKYASDKQRMFLASRIGEHHLLLDPGLKGLRTLVVYKKIQYVWELCMYTEDQLLEMPFFTRAELHYIRMLFDAYSISLGSVSDNEETIATFKQITDQQAKQERADKLFFLTQSLSEFSRKTGILPESLWYFINVCEHSVSPIRYCWELLDRKILSEQYEPDMTIPYWPYMPIYFAFALIGVYYDTLLSDEYKQILYQWTYGRYSSL